MLLKIFDIVTTVIQSILIVSMTNNIVCKESKLSKVKYLTCISLISSEIIFFTYSGLNGLVANLLMIACALIILVLFFRKNVTDALLGFGVVYSSTVISSYFVTSFYKYLLAGLATNFSPTMQFIIFVYIPIWIIYLLLFAERRHIFNAVILFKRIKTVSYFILMMLYLLIVLDCIRINLTIENIGALFEGMIYLVTFFFLTLIIIYFAKLSDDSREVELLNNALNEKVMELRKIKHDFGSEISALYGLYQLRRIDRLGELLKGIVNRYQEMSDLINVEVQSSPLVTSVLHYAVSKGVNVMIVDEGSYENLTITDNELLKLLSNIIRNSVDELKTAKNPTIKYRSYNNYDGIVIILSNNGPEIPEKTRAKMFQAGFSTKENENNDRGFGLSIVADIIKKCRGNISVESNKAWTTFILTIPKKSFKRNYNFEKK